MSSEGDRFSVGVGESYDGLRKSTGKWLFGSRYVAGSPSHLGASGCRRCTGVSPSKSVAVQVVWAMCLTRSPTDILEGRVTL